RRREEEERRKREVEERELRKIKDQLESQRRAQEEAEKRIRDHHQSEIAKRAKEEEERLLLIKIETERREKHRLEQLTLEEKARREVDERARRLSEERREVEAERRRLEDERRRLEGRKVEELKKIEEERLSLDEQRRLLTHEKSQTETERKKIEEEMREAEKRRKEDEETRRRREIERKAREEDKRKRLENERRREREEEERKMKSMEEKNITITYEKTIERTRTEEVDERIIDYAPTSPTAYMTRTYLNGDGPRQVTVIEEGGHHHHRHEGESPIGDAPIVRFVFDESTRSYIHHLVEPTAHHRDRSPGRNEPAGVRILSRTETLIDDPFDGDVDPRFRRHSPGRVGHHRMSSPTGEERYQHVRGPTDLRSPGVAMTPADGLSSPEMVRRAEALRRTNQDVQRDSYPSGRESRKRERTQYENLPMDDAGNAYIIPDRMRHSKSPIIMRVKMSPKENSSPHQSAVAPPLPPIQREQAIPVQSTPAAEYSPPPLYQRTPPANASLPQRRGQTPSTVHFGPVVGAGAKPVTAGNGAPRDQYTAIQRPSHPPPTPAHRSSLKGTPIAPVLTPPPQAQSPSHVPPAYIRPPRQLGDDDVLSPAGKAPVYGIDRPGQLLPPVPIHKHPQQPQQQQLAPLARAEDTYGGRKPAGMSAEEEREYLLRLRPLDEYNRIPGEAEKGYRPQDATWSSKPHPVETSTPENEKRKKEKPKKKKEPIFILFDRHRTRPLQCWDWVLPICCFCIAPIILILIVIGIILTYALN
ncbi:hypothetical protein PENTCL1PPCAC_25465, partial [Pristionchus entomophagus]